MKIITTETHPEETFKKELEISRIKWKYVEPYWCSEVRINIVGYLDQTIFKRQWYYISAINRECFSDWFCKKMTGNFIVKQGLDEYHIFSQEALSYFSIILKSEKILELGEKLND